jgi:hypothetical protein
MVSSSQIKERIVQFLDGHMDLENFENWFIQNTWNIHLSGSTAAESLTFAVEESLSEYSSKNISEQQLCEELRQILQAENIMVEIVDVPQIVYRFRSSGPLVFAPLMV